MTAPIDQLLFTLCDGPTAPGPAAEHRHHLPDDLQSLDGSDDGMQHEMPALPLVDSAASAHTQPATGLGPATRGTTAASGGQPSTAPGRTANHPGPKQPPGPLSSDAASSAPSATISPTAAALQLPPDMPRVCVGVTAQPPPRIRNVYVAALPLSFTDADLRSLLEPYGAVESARLFNTGQRVLEIGRAYGFALYKDPACAEAAVKGLDGMQLGTARIQCHLSRNGVVKPPRDAFATAAATTSPTSTALAPPVAAAAGPAMMGSVSNSTSIIVPMQHAGGIEALLATPPHNNSSSSNPHPHQFLYSPQQQQPPQPQQQQYQPLHHQQQQPPHPVAPSCMSPANLGRSAQGGAAGPAWYPHNRSQSFEVQASSSAATFLPCVSGGVAAGGVSGSWAGASGLLSSGPGAIGAANTLPPWPLVPLASPTNNNGQQVATPTTSPGEDHLAPPIVPMPHVLPTQPTPPPYHHRAHHHHHHHPQPYADSAAPGPNPRGVASATAGYPAPLPPPSASAYPAHGPPPALPMYGAPQLQQQHHPFLHHPQLFQQPSYPPHYQQQQQAQQGFAVPPPPPQAAAYHHPATALDNLRGHYHHHHGQHHHHHMAPPHHVHVPPPPPHAPYPQAPQYSHQYPPSEPTGTPLIPTHPSAQASTGNAYPAAFAA